MVDPSDTQSKTTITPLRGGVHPMLQAAGILLLVAVVVAINSIPSLSGRADHSVVWGAKGLSYLFVIVFAFVGVWLSGVSRRRAQRRYADSLRVWPANTAALSDASIDGARVTVTGTVRSTGRTLDRDGTACVAASEVISRERGTGTLVTEMLQFVIETVAKERVLVRASNAVVSQGVAIDEQTVIPVDAEVEVVGQLVTVAGGATEQGGYREASTTKALMSGPAGPVVMRVRVGTGA